MSVLLTQKRKYCLANHKLIPSLLAQGDATSVTVINREALWIITQSPLASKDKSSCRSVVPAVKKFRWTTKELECLQESDNKNLQFMAHKKLC